MLDGSEVSVRMADEFRQNALDCLELAQKASDSSERSVLLELAQAWTRFANHAALVPGLNEVDELARAASPGDAGWARSHRQH